MAETTYRINPELPRYERVPVFMEGEWFPGGVPEPKQFDAAYIQALAASYDPAWTPATGNCDHSRWWGKALGVITALYAEKNEAGLMTLYADVANVDRELAEEIDNGQWPSRSLEWHDAEVIAGWMHGEAWELHVDEYLFYGEHRLYVTGLALLGQRLPAVAGLGQWPEPVSLTEPIDEDIEIRIITETVAASQHAAPMRLRLVNPNSPQEDAPMADKATATKTTTGEPDTQAARPDNPAPEASATQEQIRENEKLRAEKAELERQEATLQQSETERISAENEQLRKERDDIRQRLDRVEADSQRRDVMASAERRSLERDRIVSELRAGGHLVPANEPAFLAAYEALHGQQPTMLATAAGERIAAEQAPLELLLAFARSCQMRSTQELAAERASQPSAGLGTDTLGWNGDPTEQDRAEAKSRKVSLKAWLKAKYDVDYDDPAGGEK